MAADLSSCLSFSSAAAAAADLRSCELFAWIHVHVCVYAQEQRHESDSGYKGRREIFHELTHTHTSSQAINHSG